MKKGFTLIELLAVITLLGLILAIAIINFTNVLDSSYDKIYAQAEDSLSNAANLLVTSCFDIGELPDYCDDYDRFEYGAQIYLSDLIEYGFMEEIEDPEKKGSYCSHDSYVIAYVASDRDALNYGFDAYLKCSKFSTPE